MIANQVNLETGEVAVVVLANYTMTEFDIGGIPSLAHLLSISISVFKEVH